MALIFSVRKNALILLIFKICLFFALILFESAGAGYRVGIESREALQ